ncbi:hypothetical protein E2C01_049544 [Portunus trituberculatus]|uniref:Uncharacterized protein n=1 Tax=Portunus trituberculatus TaxID=210409 RepID=A0A5B7G9R1_PORTR|nr:hypothetical protein [Portunus trituberculatus]
MIDPSLCQASRTPHYLALYSSSLIQHPRGRLALFGGGEGSAAHPTLVHDRKLFRVLQKGVLAPVKPGQSSLCR